MTSEAEFVASTVDPRIGALVHDKYRILRKLGEGGMGAVYEGEHALIKKRVALKFLHPQFASSAQVVGRFYREATSATAIGNEHIIEVTDLGREPDGSVFMVLEFLDGQSLGTMLANVGHAPLGRVVHIAMQICEALGAAHAKGIVHRDLKPDNVFLITRSGDPDFVKVLDFGIAKVLDASDGLGVATRTHASLGTPYYMSPEQCQGAKDVDARTDLYALGIILHRALSGAYPFVADAFPALVLQICTQPPTGIRFYRPEVPAEFEKIILRLLAKEKADRFPDAASLRAALAPFENFDKSGDGAIRNVPPMAPPPPAPAAGATGPQLQTVLPARSVAPSTDASLQQMGIGRRSSRMGVMVGGAVLACAVVGGLVFVRSRGSHSNAPSGDQRGSGTPPETRVVAPPHGETVPPPQTPPAGPLQPPPPPPAQTQADNAAAQASDPFAVTPGARVRVQIMSNPDDAQLLLNGRQIANPFDAELPQSTVVHRLEARRDGFTTIVQDLVLEFPQTVRLRLVHGGGVQDLRRATQPSARGAHANAATPTGPAAVVTAHETPSAPANPTTPPPATPTEAHEQHTGVPPPARGVRSPF